MYASCAPKDDAWFTELDECYVSTKKSPTSDPLVWHDWSPKSSQDPGGCGNLSLSVAAGPVTATMNLATCEELIPTKGEEPADFRVNWVGDAYWDGDVRETGLLHAVGFANPGSNIMVLAFDYGYIYSSCNPPPDLIDQCG